MDPPKEGSMDPPQDQETFEDFWSLLPAGSAQGELYSEGNVLSAGLLFPLPPIESVLEEDGVSSSIASISSSDFASMHGSTIISTEDYPGPHDLQLEFPQTGTAKSVSCTYSPVLKKLFCQLGKTCRILIRVKIPPPSGSIIRIVAVYKSSNHMAEVVSRCPHHERSMEADNDFAPRSHLIQVVDNPNTYYTEDSNGRHNVYVPYEEPQVGCEGTLLLLKYMCNSSCMGGMNRRPVMTIITLQSKEGFLLGHRCFEVRICFCPGRDRRAEEDIFQSKNSKKRFALQGHGKKESSSSSSGTVGKREEKSYLVTSKGASAPRDNTTKGNEGNVERCSNDELGPFLGYKKHLIKQHKVDQPATKSSKVTSKAHGLFRSSFKKVRIKRPKIDQPTSDTSELTPETEKGYGEKEQSSSTSSERYKDGADYFSWADTPLYLQDMANEAHGPFMSSRIKDWRKRHKSDQPAADTWELTPETEEPYEVLSFMSLLANEDKADLVVSAETAAPLDLAAKGREADEEYGALSFMRSMGCDDKADLVVSAETAAPLDPAAKGREEASQETKEPEMSDMKMTIDSFSCKICGKAQDLAALVWPTGSFSRFFRLKLNAPGLYRCGQTGIKFLVKSSVIIEYKLDSWSNHLKDIPDDTYEILGPLFNINAIGEPNAVSAVYLPHYLCLKDFYEDTAQIKCAHFKDGNLMLETPTKIDPFYIMLENPTFSLLGILMSFGNKKVSIHGIVLIYFTILCKGDPAEEYRIHLYVLPHTINAEEILDNKNKKIGYLRVIKPEQTTETVYKETKYRVIGQPALIARPKTVKFQSERYHYTEIQLKEKQRDIDLSLSEENSEDPVWEAQLTQSDIKNITQLLSQITIHEGEYGPLQDSNNHFLDIYRKDLITQITMVDPVLDDLLADELITHEQYDIVRSKSTSQKQMRQLYDFLSYLQSIDKDKVITALEKHNPSLKIWKLKVLKTS